MRELEDRIRDYSGFRRRLVSPGRPFQVLQSWNSVILHQLALAALNFGRVEIDEEGSSSNSILSKRPFEDATALARSSRLLIGAPLTLLTTRCSRSS